MASFVALVATLCLTGGACTRPTPGYCGGDGGARRCLDKNLVCNPKTLLCEQPHDGGSDGVDGSDARDAGDAGAGDASDATDGNADVPFRCMSQAACASSDAGHACLVEAGTCVECLVAGDCTAATRPICAANACRGCAGNTECMGPDGGHVCSPDAGACVECVASGDCTTATRPVCAANACRGCTGSSECTTPDAGHACFADAGTCVECVVSADCKTTALPVCDAHACRACRTDAECPDPGICMEDGHCADSGDVLFVEFKSGGCPNAAATGTSPDPFCAPADAVAHLGSTKRTIVIRGAVADPLSLNTSAGPVVVVGKQSSTGAQASIPANAGTAVSVLGGDVLIRDLKVTTGTASGSLGIAVQNLGTRLRLLRVTVNLGMGLGVATGSGGAELDMDRCIVQNNDRGGIFLTGASYDITNTLIANNGPGPTGVVMFGGVYIDSPPPAGRSRFMFNTVVYNKPYGLLCTANYPVTGTVVYGNLSGAGLNCAIVECCAGLDPMLTTDYHLMSSSPCIGKIADSMSVTHDIDGQSRPAVMSDCGADQH